MPWQAAREQRLHLDRGAPAARPAAAAPDGCPFEAIVTAAACRQRLVLPCRLLGELLSAHETSISLVARRITPLLEEHCITRQHSGIRIATHDQLRKHAATSGITLPPAQHHRQRQNTKAASLKDTPKLKSTTIGDFSFVIMLDVTLGSCLAAEKPAGRARAFPRAPRPKTDGGRSDNEGQPSQRPARYNVPAELQSSSVSVTAIAKPRARMMFPPAATTRGAPTTGATPIMTP